MPKNRGGAKSPPSTLRIPYQALRWCERSFAVLDQRELPSRKVYFQIPDIPTACEAIRTLAVRGAPLIGVASALAVANVSRKGASFKELIRGISELARTRPTAVNLFVALKRMKKVIEACASNQEIVKEALAIWKEEEERSFAMAKEGQRLIKKGMCVITYCNSGALAAPGLGTALGIIIKAHLDGKGIEVVVPETRPLLQGARLTAWELEQWKVSYTLVTESALASVMQRVEAAFVGADRIAANGDVANKVGTHGLAIIARHFNVPFYVVAPTSTLDLHLKNGTEIPVEHRSAEEVRSVGICPISPRRAKVINPAFDVTPSRLVSGIVTEKGILQPPYRKGLGIGK